LLTNKAYEKVLREYPEYFARVNKFKGI